MLSYLDNNYSVNTISFQKLNTYINVSIVEQIFCRFFQTSRSFFQKNCLNFVEDKIM